MVLVKLSAPFFAILFAREMLFYTARLAPMGSRSALSLFFQNFIEAIALTAWLATLKESEQNLTFLRKKSAHPP